MLMLNKGDRSQSELEVYVSSLEFVGLSFAPAKQDNPARSQASTHEPKSVGGQVACHVQSARTICSRPSTICGSVLLLPCRQPHDQAAKLRLHTPPQHHRPPSPQQECFVVAPRAKSSEAPRNPTSADTNQSEKKNGRAMAERQAIQR